MAAPAAPAPTTATPTGQLSTLNHLARNVQQLHESQGHMQTFLQVTVQKQLSDISRSVTESQRTLHADMVCLQREYVPKAEFKDLALRNDQLLNNQAGMEKKMAELENQVHSAQGKIKTLEEENMKQFLQLNPDAMVG